MFVGSVYPVIQGRCTKVNQGWCSKLRKVQLGGVGCDHMGVIIWVCHYGWCGTAGMSTWMVRYKGMLIQSAMTQQGTL